MERNGLVSVTSIENYPLLNQKQREVLVRTGLKYLQERKITINPRSVEQAGLVMQDALERGLRITGKEFMGIKDSPANLIKLGMQERDRIRADAARIVSKATTEPVANQLIGPLAFSSQDVAAARSQLGNYNISGDIKPSEKLVKLQDERLSQLEEMKEKAILHLPSTIQGNARRMIESTEEKAKLIRNLIASEVFRGNKNPFISIDDLLEFSNNFKDNPDNYFTQQNLESVSEIGGYSEALFHQLKDIFNASQKYSIDSKDQLFREFNNGMLILHPALEEEPISHNPKDVYSGVQTVWDRGFTTKAEGFLVPKRETLHAALRQARAAASNSSIQKLEAGNSLYNRLERNKQLYPAKIASLRNQIRRKEERIKRLENENGKYDSVMDLGYMNNAKQIAESRFNASRNLLRMAEGIISEDRARVRAISNLKKNVVNWEKDRTPFDIPQEMYRNHLATKASRLARSEGALERKFNLGQIEINRLISGSLLKSVVKEEIYERIDLEKNSEDEVIENVKKLILETAKNGGNIFNEDNIAPTRSFVRNQVRLYATYKDARTAARIDDKSLKEFKKLLSKSNTFIPDEKLTDYISQATLIRIYKSITNLKSTRNKITQVNKMREALTKEINERYEKVVEIPKEAYENLNWVHIQYQETLVSATPAVMTRGIEKSAHILHDVRDFIALRDILPKRVNKRKFRSAINKFLKSDYFRFRRGSRTYRRETREEAANAFLSIMNSPVASFDQARGMETERYLELLNRKRISLDKYFNIPKYREEYVKDLKNFEYLSHQRDILKEMFDVMHLKDELDRQIKYGRPEVVFAEGMKRLNLAIPANE